MSKVIERMLPCKLTHLEIHEKIKKLRVKMDELREINTREKFYKDEIKEAKKEVEPDIGILTKEISEESELRTVKCAVMYDTENLDCYTVRLDTGDQVGKPRRMTQEEIEEQAKIDLVREAEKGRAGESSTAPPPDVAADGAEPANLEPQEPDVDQATGEIPSLTVEPGQEAQEPPADPDGWLADGEAARRSQEAAQASLDGQEAPGAEAVDEWAGAEFPGAQAAQEGAGAEEKAQG
jgi:hypothetical protein